jgi:hypothetical protein
VLPPGEWEHCHAPILKIIAPTSTVGVELPDLQAARDEAIGAAGQILRDGAAKNLWGGKPWRMWVTQSPFANEKPLFVLRFSAAEE